MRLRRLFAWGYVVVLLPPLLLAASATLGEPWLVFGTGLLLFPLARTLFGAYRPGERVRTAHWQAAVLDALPRTYAGALIGALGVVLWRWADSSIPITAMLPWTLSLWMTLVFGACVAHALLHSRSPSDGHLGHVLAGVAGYPVLAYEHLRHHRLAGRTAAAEAPALSESLWSFASRRLVRIGSEALGRRGIAWWGDHRSPTVAGLRVGLASTAASLALFALVGGVPGAIIYLAAACLVAFGMQLVTYLQHWGLGEDQIADAPLRGLAWEDDCRFQGWMTLNLSLHQAHHDDAVRPYYALGLALHSPRLPAGYVLLMFAAVIPPLWRKVMLPALEYWRAAGTSPPSAGRRMTCVAVYRPAKQNAPA
jgi:alkane 1-monooxygenase